MWVLVAFESQLYSRMCYSLLCMLWWWWGSGSSNTDILRGTGNVTEWQESFLHAQADGFQVGKQWTNSLIRLCFILKIPSSSFDGELTSRLHSSSYLCIIGGKSSIIYLLFQQVEEYESLH